MTPIETAVIVALPEAEEAVGRLRAELDRSAAWGVPAHLTVLYPFLPPGAVDQRVLAALAAAVATVPAFEVALVRCGWFGEVLWLAPEPAQPFRRLTTAVHRRFPDHPPYRGAHPALVPHLTVGHDAPVQALRAAAAEIAARLPILARVRSARLIQGSTAAGSWHTVTELPLGSAARSTDQRSGPAGPRATPGSAAPGC
ncbi:MAG: 2'-5' RNA ligase family protein [Natronosporangium sp.]